MLLSAEQLAYQARALAQTDPWTRAARRYSETTIGEHVAAGKDLPKEFAQWASAAMLKGYCIRAVEENDAALEVTTEGNTEDDAELARTTTAVVEVVRGGEDGAVALSAVLLGDEDRLLEALDRIVVSELSTRYNNMSSTPNVAQRSEFEEWMAHWVVVGYALRTAELITGALVRA